MTGALALNGYGASPRFDKLAVLGDDEIESVSGGIVPFIILAAGVIGTAYAAGYVVGRALDYLEESQ